MKQFFLVVISLIFSATTVSAQQGGLSDKEKVFIMQRFPQYMLEKVLADAELVPVTEKYAKRHDDQYIYKDLAGNDYKGVLRVGDTILVFKGKPFFSKGQLRYMDESPKEKVVKVKQPKSAEEKAANREVLVKGASILLNTGVSILGASNASLGSVTGPPRMGNASTRF